MRGMWWDVRYAVRGLRRAPVMTAGVILMLAVGVGANIAVFRAAYGLLVKALPYADAGRLVRVGRVRSGQEGVGELSRRAFVALRNEGRSFTGVAGYAPRTLAWVAPEGPVLLRGATVSPALFRLLGTTIHAGRLFTEAEATAGRHRVVLLSYGTWTRRFSADPAVIGILGGPAVIGSGVMLGNATYTVVGVLAQDVAFPSPEVEFWVPMVLWSPEADLNRVRVTFPVVGRLKPGVAIEQARAELGAIAGRSGVGRSSGFEERVVPLREEMTARYRPALLVLLVAAGLLFLVVGVNVTGLLLASLLARRHQFAMLGVLGASRTRIVRTLLFEAIRWESPAVRQAWSRPRWGSGSLPLWFPSPSGRSWQVRACWESPAVRQAWSRPRWGSGSLPLWFPSPSGRSWQVRAIGWVRCDSLGWRWRDRRCCLGDALVEAGARAPPLREWVAGG